MRKPLTTVIENPQDYVHELVHVQGWPVGCVFRLISSKEGTHTLKTPKNGKIYTTKNKLLLTRKHQEALEG